MQKVRKVIVKHVVPHREDLMQMGSTGVWPFPLGLESGVKLADGHRAPLLIQNLNSFICVIAGVHRGLDLCDEEHGELRPLLPRLLSL